MSRLARATDSIVLTSIAIYLRVKSVRYAPHLRSERFSRFLDCLKRQAESLSKSAYISPFLSIASGRDARRLKYFHFEHRGFDKSDHLTPSPDRGDETAGQRLDNGRGPALQSHNPGRWAMRSATPRPRLGALVMLALCDSEKRPSRSPVQLRLLRSDRTPAAPAPVQGRTMARSLRGTPWQS